MSLCPNCKREGPHFVPPSLGEEGFYICDPGVTTASSAETEPLDFNKLSELVSHANKLQAEADSILMPLVPAHIGAMDALLSGLRRTLREQHTAELKKLTSGKHTGNDLREIESRHAQDRRRLQSGIDRLWELFRERTRS